MSYVAASTLIHTGNEFNTFKIFVNLMTREAMLHNFYSFNMEHVNLVFHIFMRLMADKLPSLYEIFMMSGINCTIFLFEWIVAMYSNIFDLEITSRIWDNIMYYGEFFIIKTGLAICHCVEQKTSIDSFENIVLIVKNVKNYVTEDELFQSLNDLKLTKA